MLGTLVKRVPAGVGMMQELDRKTTSLAAPAFGIYYGEYETGLKQGFGIQINDTSIYAGDFEGGFRSGRGRLDLADGMTIIGPFGVKMNNGLPQTGIFKNPYMEGEPNGQVEIYYGDGGYYRGDMVNGEVTGQGDYQSAFNEIMSGSFKNGLLHGDKSFLQTTTEDVYMGRFEEGELHGPGTFINKAGDVYEGYWDSAMRHGRGLMKYKDIGCYRGYFVNDLKHGKGSLEYGLLPKTHHHHHHHHQQGSPGKNGDKFNARDVHEEKSKEKPQKEHQSNHAVDESQPFSPFKYMYQGYFMANNIVNRGSLMNTQTQVPHIISRLDKRAVLPIQKILKRELRQQKQSNRLMDKYIDMEQFIREDICAKKLKIFKQQRHITKKMMYEYDLTDELDDDKLTVKHAIRAERMAALKPDKHLYKKALIPRLKNLNNKLFTNYKDAYERIQPDERLIVNGVISNSVDAVNETLLKLALSNFEEVHERSRLLKYDLIWQRAEDAFINAQKSAT